MLVLFETAAGFAIFKVLNEGKIKEATDLYEDFKTVGSAKKIVSLKEFHKFENTTEALAAASAMVESKLNKGLKKFLKDSVLNKEIKDKLAVQDSKLGTLIKEELGIKCVSGNAINELMRGIRLQICNLIQGLQESDLNAMSLGLSHSLSRYKLKFSPDKVDTMIVQAIGLLDDLDKELNTYAMRVKEWYGWHFPELAKVIPDNLMYCRVVKKMGMRTNAASTDFSDIVPEELAAELKEVVQVSMGTEISEEDVDHVSDLCQQVIDIYEYRDQLFEYLKNRMQAIAPNLTIMVGELVGARLIAHAGSLLNLAKHPASTVQILGAEKALFRALKTKHETPKYGLIYHASLIGQTTPKNKGKISRVLAAKTALSVRVDALGEKEEVVNIAADLRAKVEERIRQVDGGQVRQISGKAKSSSHIEKFTPTPSSSYNPTSDSTLGKSVDKKIKSEPAEEGEKKKKKKKKAVEETGNGETEEKKKKKKRRDSESGEADGEGKKKKKRRRESESSEKADGEKKKKKKKSKSE